MSGDLEDFLRRAAQRRQAKAQQQQQQKPAATPRPRPQYTNRHTERVVRPVEHDEVLTAEVVEDINAESFKDRLKRLEVAKEAAALAEAAVAKRLQQVQSGRSSTSGAAAAAVATTADDLIAMLRKPSGIRQAILLREILERPEHRW